MKLLFVRHGETDWNKQEKIQGSTDTDLNETGLQQAQELGKELEKESNKIRKIYTSRLKRAKLTAEMIAQHIGATVIVLDGLEELDLGIWEGLSWTEVQARYPEEFAAFAANRRYTQIRDGESYQIMLDRLFAALGKVINEREEEVLLVTHSAVIRGLMTYLAGVPFEDMMQFKIPNMSVYKVNSEEIRKFKKHTENI
jgi:probable phosphoglycerate mutase